MLVLSRKVGERIVIGNGVEVVVVEIQRGKVRLGIVAPNTVAVDRAEVRNRKEDERRRGEHGTIPQ